MNSLYPVACRLRIGKVPAALAAVSFLSALPGAAGRELLLAGVATIS